MDPILLPFISSTNESEREQLLTDLIQQHASPLIRQAIKQRLNCSLNQNGANSGKPHAEDIFHDVIVKLIEQLQALRTEPRKAVIRNFRQYVTRIATNSCHNYLRTKAPVRYRLKHSLRDLLGRHSDFSVWRSDNHESLCGFAEWQGRPLTNHSLDCFQLLESNPEPFISSVFPDEKLEQVPQAKLIAEVFKWVASPIRFDQLVSLVTTLLEVKDNPSEPLEVDDHLANQLKDSTVSFESDLEAREILVWLWEFVRQLPPKQRETYVFGFSDVAGDDLFTSLASAQVATLDDFIDVFGLPAGKLMQLWKRMPLDNAALAEELGATLQQIYKWRFEATRRLEKEMPARLKRKM